MGNRRHVSPSVKENVARLSLDPKLRVSDIALQAGVSENTVRRTLDKWRKKGRTTEVRAAAPKGRPTMLGQQELEFLEQRARDSPNMPLSDLRNALRDEFDVEISTTTIYRTLRKLGLISNTLETTPPQEEARDEDEAEAAPRKTFEELNQERCTQFLAQARAPDVRTLVFVGEISCRNSPLLARAPSSEFEPADNPSWGEWAVSQRREPVLLALSHAGILDVSVSTGAGAASTFVTRLLDAMRPFPAPHSVLVLDSTRSRLIDAMKDSEREAHARGIIVLQRPPCTPGLNPLECAGALIQRSFSLMSRGPSAAADGYCMLNGHPPLDEQSASADDLEDSMDALLDSLSTITPERALCWLRKCGYCA
ncbi:hypothetical protein DFH11DRAFT_1543142 [Phellopilus nigrolimitatus]|nr:hypothetical protein DFH11DRAFT_1543142 [Phellopilus nigrolimitatus]